jgi:predicted permease
MRQILNWLKRGNLERGLDRELGYHVERRAADLKRAGMAEDAARRQAMRELGGYAQVQEEVRDVWLSRWLRDFAYDLRYSVRSFLRSPSFTVTTVLSLALGIGATTAIYSLVNQVILRALPVRQPERLVLVDWKGPQLANGFGSYNLMSYPICLDLQKQDQVFDGVLCRAATTVNLSTGGDHKPAAAEIVSASYFSVLGVGAAAGRVIGTADDGAPGTNPVVVLSYEFWQTQLGGAADVVGRKVLINKNPMTVIGVADASFRGVDVGETPALWIPATMSGQAIPGFNTLLDRRTRWMQILGRLRPNLTPEQAQARLQPWFHSMLEEDTRRPGFPKVVPEKQREFLDSRLELTEAPQGHSPLRRRLSQPLWVLLAATGVLLSLACLNVAGLFLARGSARGREIGTRLALGASRGRIGRQFLADSVVLALSGGTVGLLLAPVAMRALIAFLPRDVAANSLQPGIDARLLLFAFAVSVAAGVLSGFAPALQAGRASFASSLRSRGGTGSGVRLRKAIVTAQIAFTLVLVIGGALFVRTLAGLIAKGPGFATSSLISFGLDPRRNGYSVNDSKQLIRRIHEELRTSPIAEASALTRFQLLTGGSWNNPMTIQTDERIVTDRDVHLNSISPGFLSTLGIRLVAGRNFDERDTRPVGEKGGPRSAIVNEGFVKRHLRGRNPLGALICQGGGPDAKPNIQIVGVVSDFGYRGIREYAEQAFFPIFEGDDAGGTFYVKVRGSSDAAFASIRAIVHHADPALPITYFRTVDEQVNRALNTERLLAALSGSFGVLALILSLVGLYGVMSFVVTQRTREIGIRLALGATQGSAIWLVLRDAMAMLAVGIGIALSCVKGLGKLVESQLFGVTAGDPAVIAAATVALGVAALGAALIPAWRASRVDPTEALRFD